MNYWKQSPQNIYVAAHRGWRSKYPENTMVAFKAAAELGVDQLETDVRITADGELVLIHDATVDRTTNGTGLVREHTLAQLQALDAGSHKGEEFKGMKIPTLIEFMEYVKTLPNMTVDIELKERFPEGEEIACSVCDRVLKIIDEYGFTDRCVINTFDGKLHEYIQQKYGNKYRRHVYYPVRYLGTGLTLFPYNDPYCCCVFSDDKREFDYIAACGVQPWSGAGVKDEETLDKAIENGAYLITCDNPDLILKLLREKGLHQ